MAQKVARKTGWTVKWRGLDHTWETEFFGDELHADQFKLLVEHAGNDWPTDAQGRLWRKGAGFVDRDEREGGTPFLKYARRRIEGLRAARDIGYDTMVRYQRYARLFTGALPVALVLNEHLEADDDLREQVIEDPTAATALLHRMMGDLTEEQLAEGAEFALEDIDKDTIAAWVQYMRVLPRSTKTIRNYHGFLHGVFGEAVEAGLIDRNPCTNTKLGKNVPVRKKVILEPDEFLLIHSQTHPDSRDFVEAAVGTGMRFSELTATRVCDWDPVHRRVHVEEAWKRGKGGMFRGEPKTEAGIRDVFVGERLAEIFDAHCKDKADDDLLFTAVKGGRIRQNVFGDRWAVAVAGARLEHGLTKTPVFHDLRHTHISWLRDANMADALIKDLVGHTDPEMTSKYGGVTQETRDRAASAIDRNLRRLRAV